jgi:aquaporin Z
MLDKFFAELLGTFVFLGIIIVSANAKHRSGGALVWLKVGLGLATSLVLIGAVSGGHLNPAVSVMLYLNNQLTLEQLIYYTIAQLLGAILAYLYYKYVAKVYINLE